MCRPAMPSRGDVCPAAKQCLLRAGERTAESRTALLGPVCWAGRFSYVPQIANINLSLLVFFISFSLSFLLFLDQPAWDFEADKPLPGLDLVPRGGSVPISRIFSIISS